MKPTVKDAKDLYSEASDAVNKEAERLCEEGMSMIDSAIAKAQHIQAAAVETGRRAAHSTDNYVRNKPWKAAAWSAGAGILVGLMVARNHQDHSR